MDCEKPLSAIIYLKSYIDRYTNERNDRIIKEIRKRKKHAKKLG